MVLDVLLERFLYQLRNALLATLGGKREQSGVLFVLDLYRWSTPDPATLVSVDRDGRELGAFVEGPLENPRGIRLSPDGRRVVLVSGQGNDAGDLWVYDRDGRPPIRLTFDGSNSRPVWILDGTRIAFSSTRTGSLDLFSIPADGSNSDPELLLTSQDAKHARTWSPQTGELLFDHVLPDTISDVFAIPVEGEREPKAVVQGKPVEGLSSLSSDGRWLAYVSTVTGGDLEVWVRSYPGPGTATRVSRNGGVEPVVWGGIRTSLKVRQHTT